MKRLAALAVAVTAAIFPFATEASASTSYAVNYHGASTSWAWDGYGTYLYHTTFTIKDVTGSRICPTYGVRDRGYLWTFTSCANPGQTTGHTFVWDAGVPAGTGQMFIRMAGWPELDHNFSIG